PALFSGDVCLLSGDPLPRPTDGLAALPTLGTLIVGKSDPTTVPIEARKQRFSGPVFVQAVRGSPNNLKEANKGNRIMSSNKAFAVGVAVVAVIAVAVPYLRQNNSNGANGV